MAVFDRGSGPPLVVIPGIQGRWEYLRPALDALARSYRVLAASLSDRQVEGTRNDPSRQLDLLADRVAAVLDERGIDRAAICGISFGGLVAVRFAARRSDRTSALVLVSAPGPDWSPGRRHRAYARAPWILGPLFLVETPLRLRAEIATALPHLADRGRFTWRQVSTLVTAPLSLRGMASRARLIGASSLRADCRAITAQTLVVTGEPGLDRVVPVASTLEYLTAIPGASGVRIDRTGHVGYLTRPPAFASAVQAFLSSTDDSRHHAA